jgi:hypothetical protein
VIESLKAGNLDFNDSGEKCQELCAKGNRAIGMADGIENKSNGESQTDCGLAGGNKNFHLKLIGS